MTRRGPAVHHPGRSRGAVRLDLDALLLLPLALVALAVLPWHARIAALIATALSLALPVALGMVVVLVLRALGAAIADRWTAVTLALAGAFGLVAELALAQAADLVGAFSVGGLGVVSIGLPALTWAGQALWSRRSGRRPGGGAATTPEAVAVAAVALLGLAFATWYRWDSPPPYHPAWDQFAHLRVVDGILDGTWSAWTTDYSTTFRVNAYFPTHHLLVAMASGWAGVQPLAVYWGGPFVVMPIVAVLGYLLARAVGSQIVAAVTAGGLVVVAGFPFQGLAFLGLLPASLALLFFPAVLLAVATEASPARRLVAVAGIGAGAIAAHWFIGAAVLVFGLGLIGLRALEARRPRLWIAAGGATAGVLLVLVLGYSGIQHLPSRPIGELDVEERTLTRVASLAQRQRDFESRVSPLVVVGSGLGALGFAVAAGRHNGRPTAWLAAAWAGSFALIFIPVSGADRGLAILPAILGPTIGWAAHLGLSVVLGPGPGLAWRGVALGAVLAIVGRTAVAPALAFENYQQNQAREAPFLSSFAPVEVQAAQAIRRTTPPTTLVISDPVSQEILGGLAQREAYGGGPYASDLALISLRAAFAEPTSAAMWRAISRLAPDGGTGPIVVAINGRTGAWLEAQVGHWVGYYRAMAPYVADPTSELGGIADRLMDGTWFQPIWRSPDMLVVAVRPGASEPAFGADPDPAAALIGGEIP